MPFRDPVEDSLHPSAGLESQEPMSSIEVVEENNAVTSAQTKSYAGGYPRSNILTEDSTPYQIEIDYVSAATSQQ